MCTNYIFLQNLLHLLSMNCPIHEEQNVTFPQAKG